MSKHVGTQIDFDLWQRFAVTAKKQDVKQSDVIRNAIRKFVEENEGEKQKNE